MAAVAGRHGGVGPGLSSGGQLAPSPDRGNGRSAIRRPRAVARAGPAAHFRHLAQIADGLLLLLAFPLAYTAKTELLPADLTRLYDPEVYIAPATVTGVATLVVLWWLGAYGSSSLSHLGYAVRRTVIAVAVALTFTLAVLFLFKLGYVSRLFVGLYGASAVVLLSAARVVFSRVASRLRASGAGAARVLLIGDADATERFAGVLAEEAAFGIAVVARLSPDALRSPADSVFGESPAPALGDPPMLGSLAEFLGREAIDEVAVASDSFSAREIGYLIEACDREGVVLHLALDALGAGLERATLEQMADHLLLSVNPQEHWPWGRAVKLAIDLVLAPLLIVLTSPLWVLIAIAIKLDSPGPVFFVQERIGLNKRRFKMVKFRSMYQGSEHLRHVLHDLNEADGPIFKLSRDPRVTRVGRILRRFDLDELPQLLNVVLGDMSLIGPRPMLPSEISGFEPWQRKRFSMQPGITGLWQVSNRLGQPFLSGLRADLDYIDRWSLRLDLEIALRTVPAVLRNRVAP
jgi:exopolysaccharide biosynthesis polyprenyl glycosylphosphotransferase